MPTVFSNNSSGTILQVGRQVQFAAFFASVAHRDLYGNSLPRARDEEMAGELAFGNRAEEHALTTPLIHIGVPRSATTTLQLNVFARLPEITLLGFPFSDADFKAVVRNITDLPADSDIQSSLAWARSKVDSVKQRSTGRVVLSYESLSNNKHVQYRVTAGRLRSVFGDSEILITIRNQFTALPSWYLHSMQSEKYMEFGDWLRLVLSDITAQRRPKHSIDWYRYDALIDGFIEEFPNTKVFLYEDMVHAPATFASALATLLGVPTEKIERLLAAPAQNRPKSSAWYRIRADYDRARPLIDLLPGSGLLKSFVSKRISGAPATVNPSSSDLELIDAFCGADNRLLARRLGIDLQSYGYPGFR